MKLDVVTDTRAPRWRRLAALSQLRSAGPFALAVDELDVAVLRRGDGWVALSGLCPHQGALLGEGEVDGDALVCRNHGWRFDVESGARVGGPQCLARFPLEERDGVLWIDTSQVEVAATKRAGKRHRRFEDLPGPRSIPFLGNALQIDPSTFHLQLERWADEYGSTFRFQLGPRRSIVVSDPALASQALRDRPETFRRPRPVGAVFRDMGVEGVFSAEGSAWRPQRQLAMRALAQRHLRSFYGTLAEVTESLRARWTRAAETSRVLDVQEEMMRFTVDVTTALVFGHNVRSIEDTEHQLQQELAHVFPALNRRLFTIFPYYRYFKLPQDRRLDRALASVREWIGTVIDEAREQLEAHPDRRTDPANFMEAMLTATDDDGEPFSDKVIYGNAMTMLLAGEDTTANTLCWAVHHLCDSPKAVTALREEVDAALGDSLIPDDLDSARGLRFASGIADEAMRLRPVAPMIFLEAVKDTTLGDLEIDRGVELVLLTRHPVLDAGLIDRPHEFRPQRWLDEKVIATIREAHAHVPFGSGPRICPGRSLAFLEMQLVLSMLFRSFDVQRVGRSSDVEEQLSFTMEPKGLRVRLRPRAN